MIEHPLRNRPKRRRKVTLKTETQKTIKSLIITLSLMIVALSVFFLMTTNENSQLGYTLQQEKLKNEKLKTENQHLNAQITNSTAFSEIENDQQLKEMATPEVKTYVNEEDNAVK